MKELHDKIALQAHLAYETLDMTQSEQALDQLRDIFNMVGVAAQGDPRFREELETVNAGALSLEGGKTERVLAAVNAVDAMLPRMDVMSLHHAIVKLRLM
jgi:hypothetical protein